MGKGTVKTKITKTKFAKKDCMAVKNNSEKFKRKENLLEKILREGEKIKTQEDLCPFAPEKKIKHTKPSFKHLLKCPKTPKRYSVTGERYLGPIPFII